MENSRKPEPIQKNGSPNRAEKPASLGFDGRGHDLDQIAADRMDD
jgi:hypothetical protein